MPQNRLSKSKIPFVTAFLWAVAGALLALFFLPEGGILYSHDSLAYLHVADSLAAGNGYEYFGYSTPMIQWALLMPTFYAFLGLFTSNVTGVMVYLNLVFLCITLLLANLTAAHVIRKSAFAVCAQVVISFSWTLWAIHSYLWSEALFLLFLNALTYFFVRWVQENKFSLVVCAGISAALMLLTRFTGMELAGVIGLFILLRPKQPMKTRLLTTVVYGLIGATPYCALMLRNYLLSGTFTGRSKPALYSFATNAKNTVYRILDWFWPGVTGSRSYVFILVLLLLVLVSLIVLLCRVCKGKETVAFGVPLFLFLHCVLYIATSLYANSTYALDGVTGRIMSPILFCGVTLFFWLLSEGGQSKQTWLRGTLLVCALVLAAFSLWRNTLHLVRYGPAQTSYYSTLSLETNPAAEYLAEMDKDAVKIWTNAPDTIYFLTGMDANYIPRRESIELYSWDACVQRWQESGKTLYVCWYNTPTNPILYQIDELQQMLSMNLVADFGTCQIYEAVLK